MGVADVFYQEGQLLELGCRQCECDCVGAVLGFPDAVRAACRSDVELLGEAEHKGVGAPQQLRPQRDSKRIVRISTVNQTGPRHPEPLKPNHTSHSRKHRLRRTKYLITIAIQCQQGEGDNLGPHHDGVVEEAVYFQGEGLSSTQADADLGDD